MNDSLLKKISNQLTILIRLAAFKEKEEKLRIDELLDLVTDMELTDIEVGKMFNVSSQAIRNARSRKKKNKK